MPTSCSSYSLRQFTWKAHNRATVIQLPNKHAGSDPEAFCAHGQLWPLRPMCSQNRVCRIRPFASDSFPFFQRSPGSYCAKPTRVLSGWPGQGLAERIRSGSKPMGMQKSSRPVLAEFNWSATSFPLSDSVAFFHRGPGSYCAKPARIRFGPGRLSQVLTDRVRYESKPVCKNHRARFWPIFPIRSRLGCEWDPACLLGYYGRLNQYPSRYMCNNYETSARA